jgi:Cu/Ag efflux protein CusF
VRVSERTMQWRRRMRTMLLLLSLSFAACGAARPRPLEGTSSAVSEAASTLGTIKEIRKGGAVLVIAHEDIPGVMPAMTMPFQVDEKARKQGLKAGERVRFWITERDGLYVIVRLERT